MSINLETLIPYNRIIESPGDVFDLVDEHGQVVLLQNNEPAYVIIRAEAALQLSSPNAQSQLKKSDYTLQEAMRIVLSEADGNTMHASDLADAIYHRGLYFKKDGTKAEYNQIRARCGHYPQLFEALPGNVIKLIESDSEELILSTTEFDAVPKEGNSMQGISKFAGLERYLNARTEERLSLTFEEIERITGEKLYPSAYKYDAYWRPSKTHVLPNLILDCGFEIEKVDLKNQIIKLKRTK